MTTYKTKQDKEIEDLTSKVTSLKFKLEELESDLFKYESMYRDLFSAVESGEPIDIEAFRPSGAVTSRLLSELYLLRSYFGKKSPEEASKLLNKQRIKIATLKAKLDSLQSKK